VPDTCPHTVRVKLALNRRELLDPAGLRAYGSERFTLKPFHWRTTWLRAVLLDYKRGKLQFFDSDSLNRPVAYATVERAFPFLEAYLSKRYARADPGDAEFDTWPEINAHLLMAETWYYDDERRTICGREQRCGILRLDHQGGQSVELHFPLPPAPDAVILSMGLSSAPAATHTEQANRYHLGELDFRIGQNSTGTSELVILLAQLYNFELFTWIGPTDNLWRKHLKESPTRHTGHLMGNVQIKPRCEQQYPLNPATVADYQLLATALGLDTAANTRLLPELVQPLLQAMLSGKVRCYYAETFEPMKQPELLRLIENHPRNPAAPTKKNVRTLDYSGGVSDVLLFGDWERNATDTTAVSFRPAYLTLGWSNPATEPPLAYQLGLVRWQDALKLFQRLDNSEVLRQFEGVPQGFHFQFRTCDDFPRNQLQAAYVYRLLRAGRWSEIPSLSDLDQLPAAELERLLQSR
jgi:hypothetical protein